MDFHDLGVSGECFYAGAVMRPGEAMAAGMKAELLGNILPFWCGPAVDHEEGGWMAWLTNDLKPDRSQPKGLIVNCRILWAFSAVHQWSPDAKIAAMAGRAFTEVSDAFWDRTHGGGFWQLNGQRQVWDGSKKIYGQAFYIYAMAEYYRAFHHQPALDRAIELFELVDRHARDAADGGYWEVRRRDWSEAEDTRLSEKDQNEKKSMNNHLHVLEAYTNLYRVRPSPRLRERLVELIRLFEERIVDAGTGHLHHFFNEKWEVRSDTCTYGHDIEASWLLWEAAEVLGDAALQARLRPLVIRMAQVCLREGVDANGGLSYEGKDGRVIDAGKECWPQAEAIVGFVNAYQLTGETSFLQAAENVWQFLRSHIVDREHGEWFWRIEADGRVNPKLPKVSEWKGPYHGTRACLEILRRFQLQPDTHH